MKIFSLSSFFYSFCKGNPENNNCYNESHTEKRPPCEQYNYHLPNISGTHYIYCLTHAQDLKNVTVLSPTGPVLKFGTKVILQTHI